MSPVIPVVPSVQDGVRATKDENISSLDGTDCLGAVLDGVDGLATLFSILSTSITSMSFLPTMLPGRTHIYTFLPSSHLDKLGGRKEGKYKCTERARWGERLKKKENSVGAPVKHGGEKGHSSTRTENKFSDNGWNHNSPHNSSITITGNVTTTTTKARRLLRSV